MVSSYFLVGCFLSVFVPVKGCNCPLGDSAYSRLNFIWWVFCILNTIKNQAKDFKNPCFFSCSCRNEFASGLPYFAIRSWSCVGRFCMGGTI